MDITAFFGLEPYHILLTVSGAALVAAYWLPRLASNEKPAAPPLLILFGMLIFWLVPNLPRVPDPREMARPWELVSELTVIVALFAAGLRIDRIGPWDKWVPTARLLLIAMPLTIAGVAVLGATWAGFTVAGAILLGAVLAPTDPVLASDVQVGPPHEGGEELVRFTLTNESGLNDGLAFPFVYLGLLVAAQGLHPGVWGMEWLLVDVLYRIVVGTAMGAAGGWVLGQVLFVVPRDSALANTASGVVSLAGVLLCYGSTELVEGYGFIAVAVMGLVLRRIENQHRFHRRLHDFCQSIEQTLVSLLLIAFGAVLPALLQDLRWSEVWLAILLIFALRPLVGWLSLTGTELNGRERQVVAFYGVRGIGSVYYLSYATSHMEFAREAQLWSVVGVTILISTIVHGLSVGHVMSALKR
ncbi:sodium:proton antiporter [Pseudoruegeria sp. SK021]|uniref:cation:proton antiporter n=1 Tax=Pseudoruegeria sp. SK021 TaxID=1933035 RepID=UPI000A22B70B|nr:cation:proton antiporter [Pseudoruegeria sp. SK021]OSP54381.1 sodium:proton antiporter [Pseudoruegeria sp. SK021]